jgi:hypothetical protein
MGKFDKISLTFLMTYFTKSLVHLLDAGRHVLDSAACANVTTAIVSKCVTGKRLSEELKLTKDPNDIYQVLQMQNSIGPGSGLVTVATYNISDKSLTLCGNNNLRSLHGNSTEPQPRKTECTDLQMFIDPQFHENCDEFNKYYPWPSFRLLPCKDGSLIQYRGLYDVEKDTERPAPQPVWSNCTPACSRHMKRQSIEPVQCCWVCKQCDVNQIVSRDGQQCEPCEELFWPDANFTACQKIPPKYTCFAFVATGTLTMIIFTLNIAIAVYFLRHREDRVIKATSWSCPC